MIGKVEHASMCCVTPVARVYRSVHEYKVHIVGKLGTASIKLRLRVDDFRRYAAN